MRKLTALIIIVMIIICAIPLRAQERIFLIPGIKFTKTFGEKPGNVLGLDLSLIFENGDDQPIWGINTTYDFKANQQKLSFGIEYINPEFLMGGISIGPAINLSEKSFGIYTVTFFSLPLIPAFQYTYFRGSEDILEFGLFAKIPLKVGGSRKGYFDLSLDMRGVHF